MPPLHKVLGVAAAVFGALVLLGLALDWSNTGLFALGAGGLLAAGVAEVIEPH